MPSPGAEAAPVPDRTGSLSSGALVPLSDGSGPEAVRPPSPSGLAFAPGDLVSGRYEVVRFIARGGMGEVFEVQDLEIKNRVALKTLIADREGDTDSVERFRREIHLARQVTHPNVCRIFDLGLHRAAGGREIRFLTMELLEGETLGERIRRRGRLPATEALAIVRQVAPALAAAHNEGIIHRDFKSSNVILAAARSGERAVVTDFGLARVSVEESDATVSGGLIGTPAYMAPEQVQGGAVTAAADIYALGVVLYEMVTGQRPFTGDSALAIAVKRLSTKPTPPRTHVPDLDPKVEAVILRCLERRPEDRFASVTDVLTVLEGGAVAPPARRRRRFWALGVALLALVAAGTFFWSARHARPGDGAARRSVAVLGFKNLGRPEQAWLSTAISEMLRTELAAGEKIRTIPGESVARMKMELALAETDSLAGDTLSRVRANVGANLVVLGSYLALPSGRIRLDLRLQDTEKGEVLASAAEEGTEAELFGLVSKSGARIRSALHIDAVTEADTPGIRAALPLDPEAARLYSEGLARLRLLDAVGARDLLRRAIVKEPDHALAHSVLASAWSALGYDAKAREEAQKALELGRALSREDRLTVEARFHETAGAWDKAVDIYHGLFVFFPDSLDHGLQLARAQTAAGRGHDALQTVATLRRLPPPATADPRLDLAEAAAAKALTDFTRQRAAASEAARRAHGQGARLLLAEARLAEGTAAVNLGDLKAADEACREAGQIFTGAGDIAGAARAQNIMAVARAKQDDLAGARKLFEEALASFRRIGDQAGIASQLDNLGNVLSQQGDLRGARGLYQEALTVSREIGDRSGAARALNNLGAVFWDLGALEDARRSLEAALAEFHDLGEAQHEAEALSSLGEVLQKMGRLDAAQQRYEASLRLSRSLDRDLAAETLGHLAQLFSRRGDQARAQKAREEAASLKP